MECTKWYCVFWTHRKYSIIVVTPLLLLPLLLVEKTDQAKCGFMLLLMGVFWVTEAIPLPVTGLIPVVLGPTLGIISTTDAVAKFYIKPTMLFTGGLIMAVAIEHCNLHKRIALSLLSLVGVTPMWIFLGFMLPTWFISMWISNTATTSMMLPIMEAVIRALQDELKLRFLSNRAPNTMQPVRSFSDCIDNDHDNNIIIEEGEPYAISYRERTVPIQQANGGHNISPMASATNNAFDALGASGPDNPEIEMIYMSQPPPQPVDDVHYHMPTVPQLEFDQQRFFIENRKFEKICKGLTIAIAYSANVGGIATLAGTLPNIVMLGECKAIFKRYGKECPIGYPSWMLYGIPVSVISIIIVYFWMVFLFADFSGFRHTTNAEQEDKKKARDVIKKQLSELGRMTFQEISVCVLFATMVILLFLRDPKFGGNFNGWGSGFKEDYVDGAVPSIFVAILLFCIPKTLPKWGHFHEWSTESLIDWKVVNQKFPWGVLFILGGGFALSEAAKLTELQESIGERLRFVEGWGDFATVLVVTLFVSFLTEITSNAATCTMSLHIVIGLANKLNKNPLRLMFPAAIASSFAFMVPSATPPNAIAYSYNRFKVYEMIKCGFLLNFLLTFAVVLVNETIGKSFFHLDEWEFMNGTSTTETPTCITASPLLNMLNATVEL